MNDARILSLANVTLTVSFIAVILTTALAYGLEGHLPMLLLVILHVLQLILAGIVKVAYVVRLVSQKQLGMALN